MTISHARHTGVSQSRSEPKSALRCRAIGFRMAYFDGHNSAMGNRLSEISTRTGDDGTTGLGDGARVRKDALRVHAMGDVDELNSNIGVLLCEPMPQDVRELLVEVQHQLFNLGGELSIPGYTLLKAEALADLDAALTRYNATLPRLAEFILPAGTRAASLAHVCRTVARRAERAVVGLGAEETLNAELRQYLNRLSDLLFVLARVLNRFREDGSGLATGDDVYWKSERLKKQAESA
jgi:cob(I)alamin adenosyltransferase